MERVYWWMVESRRGGFSKGRELYLVERNGGVEVKEDLEGGVRGL